MQNKKIAVSLLLFILVVFGGLTQYKPVFSSGDVTNNDTVIYLPYTFTSPPEPTSQGDWPMVAGNQARTSWSSEEIKGKLYPHWYRPLEPYILPRVQIIAAYDTLYISTARGLYAFDAASGTQKWVYPTELPLGNSPTIYDGVAYVGGFDHKLHAINAFTGQGLWTFEAEAGFDTNPLVINGKVYVGNRDGNFYAINIEGPAMGELAWKYFAEGPIHFSAAYKSGIIYFASNDCFAYALNAVSGQLVWKSEKLPGAGFHSWWPVIYQDWVIFSTSDNYRNKTNPGPGSMFKQDKLAIFPHLEEDPKGTLVGALGTEPGNWVSGTPTIDTSQPETTPNGSTYPIMDYFERDPWRRNVILLDRFTGQEYTTDLDGDSLPEYAPILWFGVRAGTRYPPVVGADNVLYQMNAYMSDPYIIGGHISGWKVGTPYISVISSDWAAVDEPHAYSVGGDVIYWKLCCDRQVGGIDTSTPNTEFADRYEAGDRPPTGGNGTPGHEWIYISYDLPEEIPGYNIMTHVSDPYYRVEGGVYGGRNGSYGWHGDESPPIPYKGRLYTIQSNALVAFSSENQPPTALPLANTIDFQDPNLPSLQTQQLKDRLAVEVEKVINTGHINPGWLSSGLFDAKGKQCVESTVDYWHHPGDIIQTLINALPHLPSELAQQTSDYIQSEFAAYSPYQYNHIGWRDGIPREPFEFPPEVISGMDDYPPQNAIYDYDVWNFAPHSFYALWKYAEVFGDAANIYNTSKDRLETVPSNNYLLEMPHVHNAYIAGYLGYLELESLAGYPETTSIKNELDRLLTLRATNFSHETPDSYIDIKDMYYCRAINTSRNFLYMVPELAEYLRINAFSKVQTAVDEYERVTPYWFVSRVETVFGEGSIGTLYDYPSIFQAKAWILGSSQEELTKYLDVPAVEIGDLYFIQNLVAAIEAEEYP